MKKVSDALQDHLKKVSDALHITQTNRKPARRRDVFAQGKCPLIGLRSPYEFGQGLE
jgi:hypothetical protein